MKSSTDNQSTEKTIDELLEKVRQHDWSISWEVAEKLATLGSSAVTRLIEKLQDEDGYIRDVAAQALGKIGDRRAVAPLISAMQYRDERVYEDGEDCEARVNAAVALGEIGDPQSFDPLVQTLESSLKNDVTLSWYVIDALGKLGDENAIPLLEPLCEHRDVDVRKSAKYALIRLKK